MKVIRSGTRLLLLALSAVLVSAHQSPDALSLATERVTTQGVLRQAPGRWEATSWLTV
jgi:hypothetical protein